MSDHDQRDHVAEATIRAAAEAAARLNRPPTTRWGTVEDYDPLSEQLQVIVDGDPTATPVTNATGTGLTVGQRALVLFTPPKGAHAIGSRPATPATYTPELFDLDEGAGTVVGEYRIDGPMAEFAVTVTLGAGFSVGALIGVGLPVVGSSIVVADWLVAARATIGGTRFTGLGLYTAADTAQVTSFATSGGSDLWDSTTPGTWGSGDVLRVSGRYPRRLLIENIDAP